MTQLIQSMPMFIGRGKFMGFTFGGGNGGGGGVSGQVIGIFPYLLTYA